MLSQTFFIIQLLHLYY